jgi:ABC-type nickel/cobalt efflux system permease component RcnA
MKKFAKYFAIAVVTLYFFLGVFVLVSPRFDSMQKELKIVFAVFLFLYGSWRLVRILTKDRANKGED